MIAIDLKKIKYKNLGFFNFKKLNGNYLLTNDAGDWVFLKENEFKAFLEGELEKNKDSYLSLANKNFLKNEADLDLAAERYRKRYSYLFQGPSLHIVVVTLRCNQKCIYCHASAQDMRRKDLDMNLKTAKKTIEMIFKSPSPFIVIEFQGGEPLANWPIVKFIIEEARKKNKNAGKNLEIKLVSNFSLMTEDRYRYLLKNNVGLCTSLDGPKKLHNKNRPIAFGDSHQNAIKWIKRFRKDYPRLLKKGYIWEMAAIMTTTRFSLPRYKEIIDEYFKLGFDNIFLRPLDPFGFSNKHWKAIGYNSDEFINFYKKSLDYIIKLNSPARRFMERTAQIFLTKIFVGKDPNMMDMRSPCGAGIGQLAYNYNGDVYTCDEGRMMNMMGDDSFKLGNVKENDYNEIVGSPITKTLCSSSCLEGQAGCSGCVYRPYCGTCPIYNYFEQGNVMGQMPTNDKCKINKAILDYLFTRLENKKIKDIFIRWIKPKLKNEKR